MRPPCPRSTSWRRRWWRCTASTRVSGSVRHGRAQVVSKTAFVSQSVSCALCGMLGWSVTLCCWKRHRLHRSALLTCSRVLPARLQLHSPAGGAPALGADQQEQGGVPRGVLLAGKPVGMVGCVHGPARPLAAIFVHVHCKKQQIDTQGIMAFSQPSEPCAFPVDRPSTAWSCGPSCWQPRQTSRSCDH